MQECLIVLVSYIEISHEPAKACAIKVQECGPYVVPGWRGVLRADHGHESFQRWFYARALGWLKILDFGIGNSDRINDASPVAHVLLPVTEECDHAGSSECHLDAS